jgi:15-cis-phytoene synthase
LHPGLQPVSSTRGVVHAMTPDQYCQEKAAPRGSRLYYSTLWLAQEQQRAVIALYALRRELIEGLEAASDPGVASAKLLWWRNELTAALGGQPRHPVMHALAPALARFALPAERLSELFDGAQMDLDYNRYPDFATLEVYCQRTGGVLAQLCAQVLYGNQAQTLSFARPLGTALELTDMVANLGEHARRNRIYLPLDELARFDLETDDIIALREDARLERLMRFQIERLQRMFADALALLPHEDRKHQRPLLAMAAIDRALLDEIAGLHGHTLNQRVSLTPLRKLWIAWKAYHLG